MTRGRHSGGHNAAYEITGKATGNYRKANLDKVIHLAQEVSQLANQHIASASRAQSISQLSRELKTTSEFAARPQLNKITQYQLEELLRHLRANKLLTGHVGRAGIGDAAETLLRRHADSKGKLKVAALAREIGMSSSSAHQFAHFFRQKHGLATGWQALAAHFAKTPAPQAKK